MTTIPGHWVRTLERHEWTLGDRDGPMDAKTFRLGLDSIMREMGELVDMGYDDAFKVQGQEDGTILFSFQWDLGSHGYTPDPPAALPGTDKENN